MDEAERFDRLALLDKGRILAIGTPGDLQQGLEGEILAVRIDRPREARAAALRCPAVRGAAVFGDRLHITVGAVASDAAAVVEHLRGAGFLVIGYEAIERSMEDVFIERIEREGHAGVAGAPGARA